MQRYELSSKPAGDSQASAEETLSRLRRRFEQRDDPRAQGELAAEALDQVERELGAIRERRQQLDSSEGKLWSRRNRLERFLIDTRGLDWWRARREHARAVNLRSAQPARSATRS
ncbi:MAG TPA: hypothetical protein VGH09_07880 [Solirubrobacteraceae bacterium]|jgi:hypothetical protein